MKKVDSAVGVFFVGKSATSGVVIFDQLIQRDLTDVWVRFYAHKNEKWLLATKEKAEQPSFWVALNEVEYLTSIGIWQTLRPKLIKLSQRTANCHSCSCRLNFNNSTLCIKCVG